MKRVLFILITILLLIYSSSVFADVLQLKDGRVLKGIIVEQNDNYLIIKTQNGAEQIELKDINKCKKGKLPQKFIATDSGVKDYLGLPLPPVKIEMDMIISVARRLTAEENKMYSQAYHDKAEEYENVVRMDTLDTEVWQSLLMTAFNYYKVSLNADSKKLRESSELGIERCQEQLFCGVEGEFILPYTDTLREYIEAYLKSIPQKQKNILLKKYFVYAQKIVNQNKVSEESIQIIKNCFLLNMNLSDTEKVKKASLILYTSL